jgi:hypothetical protein
VPLSVHIFGEQGECWDGTFTGADVTSVGGKFKAKVGE